MTGHQLLRILQNMLDTDLSKSITIYDKLEDEYYGILRGEVLKEDTEVLDKGTLILNIRK